MFNLINNVLYFIVILFITIFFIYCGNNPYDEVGNEYVIQELNKGKEVIYFGNRIKEKVDVYF